MKTEKKERKERNAAREDDADGSERAGVCDLTKWEWDSQLTDGGRGTRGNVNIRGKIDAFCCFCCPRSKRRDPPDVGNGRYRGVAW